MLLSLVSARAGAAEASRPNILFVFADDWGVGLVMLSTSSDLSDGPPLKTPTMNQAIEDYLVGPSFLEGGLDRLFAVLSGKGECDARSEKSDAE